LDRHVAELRRTAGAKVRAGSFGHEASKDASLNFSLTEQTLDGSKGPRGIGVAGDAGDASLDFSLTNDMSSQPQAGKKSGIGKSALEERDEKRSRELEEELGLEKSDDEASGSAASESLSASGASGSSTGKKNKSQKDQRSPESSKGSSQKGLLGDLPALGGRGQRKSPKAGDVLDSLMGGDISDPVLGGTGSKLQGRPRPTQLDPNDSSSSGLKGLASVVEEGLDAADKTPESKGSNSSGAGKSPADTSKSPANTSKSPAKKSPSTSKSPVAAKATKVVSPPLSPSDSAGILEASLVSQTDDLGRSASCNEISMGPDISVEDSLELEKCDHVEDVLPSSPRDQPGNVGKVTNLKGAPIMQVTAQRAEAKSVPKSPASSASSPGSKQESPAAASKAAARPVGIGIGAASSSLAPIGAKVTSPNKDDDDEYHESFDDMSVAESIEESLDGSGSGAWGANASGS